MPLMARNVQFGRSDRTKTDGNFNMCMEEVTIPSLSGSKAHRFWPLHRVVHAYDALAFVLSLMIRLILKFHSIRVLPTEVRNPQRNSRAPRTKQKTKQQFREQKNSYRPSGRNNPRTSHLKRRKEEDRAREVETGFPPMTTRNRPLLMPQLLCWRTFATACSPSLPRFHFSQLAQLPYEWPMAD